MRCSKCGGPIDIHDGECVYTKNECARVEGLLLVAKAIRARFSLAISEEPGDFPGRALWSDLDNAIAACDKDQP